MDDQASYRVQEFARLAGVTVRTLHFYDSSGLLRPSGRSASGHRRYRAQDLLRLQQILTLKHLGFGLDEIRALLDAPAYDLGASLRIQKEALEARIRQLQGAVFAIGRTLETIEQTQAVDWTQVVAIIHGLREADKREWLRRYFPPEVWDWLLERSAAAPPALLDQGARVWRELYAELARLGHLPPEHPEVQRVAARMQEQIDRFTNRDPAVERGLSALYREGQVPAAYQAARDPQLQALAGRALEIYRGTTKDCGAGEGEGEASPPSTPPTPST